MPDDDVTLETVRSNHERALVVGTRAYVNFDKGQKVPAVVEVLGWRVEKFLLLSAPQGQATHVRFSAGAPWVLKYVAGGWVWVAHTRFLERSIPRIGGVYVTFPEEFLAHSLRAELRVSVRMSARYAVLDDAAAGPESWTETLVRDLSPGGCALEVLDPVETGMRLSITLAAAAGETPLVFTGAVRHCSTGPYGRIAGVQFDPLEGPHRVALVRLIGDAAEGPDVLLGDA